MTNSDLVGKIILEGFARGNDVERVIESAESLGFKISEAFVLRQFKNIERYIGGKRDETSTRQETISNGISSPVRCKQTVSRYTERL